MKETQIPIQDASLGEPLMKPDDVAKMVRRVNFSLEELEQQLKSRDEEISFCYQFIRQQNLWPDFLRYVKG